MSISDINQQRHQALKTSMIYLLLSLFCIALGMIYEYFSFGVYSNYMIYAFLFPLIGGVLPFLSMGILGRRIPERLASHLYHSGIATLTVGSIVEGVIRIYGTTNRLTWCYWVVGLNLALAGIVVYIWKDRQID